jgi:hypothetical protein
MEAEHVKSHISISRQNQSTIGTTLKRIERSGIWPTPEAHSTSNTQRASPRANDSRWMHQSANDSIQASTAYWTMWLPSITFGFSSTTMNHKQLDAIQNQ